MAQANKGGEIGINGEFYKGGQFMANDETTVKGMQNRNSAKTRRPARKVEIERGVYEFAPEGMVAIYTFCSSYLNLSATGEATVNVKACEWIARECKSDAAKVIANMTETAAAWNRGERWMARS